MMTDPEFLDVFDVKVVKVMPMKRCANLTRPVDETTAQSFSEMKTDRKNLHIQ
jgi:hypothetical protein